MKNLSKLGVLALLVCGIETAAAQSTVKEDGSKKAIEVKDLVNGGRYTFAAETAITKKGESSPVSYGTGLDISKDTLIVYLPGAGKTTDTSLSTPASGITCVHFGYNAMPGANGSYDVSIIPEENYSRDVKNIKKITIHISKQGYADLVLITADHGQLAYHGYIRQPAAMFTDTEDVASDY